MAINTDKNSYTIFFAVIMVISGRFYPSRICQRVETNDQRQ